MQEQGAEVRLLTYFLACSGVFARVPLPFIHVNQHGLHTACLVCIKLYNSYVITVNISFVQ